MTVGDRIRRRREELEMSQDELAKRLGYKSRSSINKIERDASGLPQRKIADIAKALQTTPRYIMGWVEKETSKKIDITTDVIIRMERDRNFSELVQKLYTLDNEKIKGVKAMLDSFFQ